MGLTVKHISPSEHQVYCGDYLFATFKHTGQSWDIQYINYDVDDDGCSDFQSSTEQVQLADWQIESIIALFNPRKQ